MRKAIQTTLICPECENKVTIWRKENRQRKFGHRKYLWCWKCRKITNHFEIKGENIK